MSDKADIQRIAQLYLEGVNRNELGSVPLAADVTLNGPMRAEPLHGEVPVREYLSETAPFMSVELRELLVDGESAAALVNLVSVNGKRLPSAVFLRVENGRICSIETLFDSHRLFTGEH